MSQTGRQKQYAPIGRPYVGMPFDREAAAALIADLAGRRALPHALRTHRLQAQEMAGAFTNGPVIRPANRRLPYAMAASVAVLALSATLTLHSRPRPAAILPSAPATSEFSEVSRAVPQASTAGASEERRAVRLASARVPSRSAPDSATVPAELAVPDGPAQSGVAAQAEPPSSIEAEAPPAQPAPAPPEVQVAALQSAADAGRPLMLVRSQDSAHLLGGGGRDGASASGLTGIQSSNPQRMVSGITGTAIR